VELLDTGLLGGGRFAAGLLAAEQTEQLSGHLESQALHSGWGLRSLGEDDERYNPFGHRGGAVRVQESVTAVAGLAAAGHERAAGSLLHGLLDAAAKFEFRLPEMYAAQQRSEGGVPLPHPAACRPAATSAAASVHLLTALAGVRPDAPAGTVALHPWKSAPIGTVRFAGLRVSGSPFSVRVNSDGEGEAEDLADGLRCVAG
jgi:glycogen debranching enzyme